MEIRLEITTFDSHVLFDFYPTQYMYLGHKVLHSIQIYTEYELLRYLTMSVRNGYLSDQLACATIDEINKRTVLIDEDCEDIFTIAHYMDECIRIELDPGLKFKYVINEYKVPIINILDNQTEEELVHGIVYQEDLYEAVLMLIHQHNVNPQYVDILPEIFKKFSLIKRPTLN